MVGQISQGMLSHFILGGRGIGRGVHEKLIMLSVSCLECLTCLLFSQNYVGIM